MNVDFHAAAGAPAADPFGNGNFKRAELFNSPRSGFFHNRPHLVGAVVRQQAVISRLPPAAKNRLPQPFAADAGRSRKNVIMTNAFFKYLRLVGFQVPHAAGFKVDHQPFVFHLHVSPWVFSAETGRKDGDFDRFLPDLQPPPVHIGDVARRAVVHGDGAVRFEGVPAKVAGIVHVSFENRDVQFLISSFYEGQFSIKRR